MNKIKLQNAIDNMPRTLGKLKLFDSKAKVHDPVGYLAKVAGVPQPKLYDKETLSNEDMEKVCQYFGLSESHIIDVMTEADYCEDTDRYSACVRMMEDWLDE